jgi:dGTPase
MLRLLFGYFTEHPEDVPEEIREAAAGEPVQRAVCDFLAGMTDRYAVRTFTNLYVVHGLERH